MQSVRYFRTFVEHIFKGKIVFSIVNFLERYFLFRGGAFLLLDFKTLTNDSVTEDINKIKWSTRKKFRVKLPLNPDN